MEKMGPVAKDITLLLLVTQAETRTYLVTLLSEHNYSPVALSDPDELVQALKGLANATVFLDCEAIPRYGAGLYSRIKVACPWCRIVLLCHKDHKTHREIIREAMEIGAYACLIAPFEGWEVLAMVRHGQSRRPTTRKRPPRKKTMA